MVILRKAPTAPLAGCVRGRGVGCLGHSGLHQQRGLRVLVPVPAHVRGHGHGHPSIEKLIRVSVADLVYPRLPAQAPVIDHRYHESPFRGHCPFDVKRMDPAPTLRTNQVAGDSESSQ